MGIIPASTDSNAKPVPRNSVKDDMMVFPGNSFSSLQNKIKEITRAAMIMLSAKNNTFYSLQKKILTGNEM